MGLIESGQSFGLALAVLLACGGVPVSPALAAAPHGEQQLNYFVYENGALVPDTTVEEHTLAEPLSWTYPKPRYTDLPYGSAVANAAGVPRVSVAASTPTATSYANFAIVNARAALAYFVYVDGPDKSINIPVGFSARLFAEAPVGDGGETATAQFTIQEYSGNPYTTSNSYIGAPVSKNIAAQNHFNGSGETAFLGLASGISVSAGTYLGIILAAEARVQAGGSASAWVDPYFYIDPSFLTSHPDYSLTFSPFVGNGPPASTVPEPSSWALLFAGFGAVGVAARRRAVFA